MTRLTLAPQAERVGPAPSVTVGLSSAEAQRRLTEFGPNEIRREQATTSLTLFARQFASPVIWLLVGASVLSAMLGEMLDAGAIGAIVLVNAVIGFLQEHRAERAVMALRSMTAPRARVMRDGHSVIIPADAIVPGDFLVLEAGDVAAARSAAEELGVVATELASPLLRAAAATAIGSVLLAEGDAEGALIALRRACRGWAELNAPYEGARSRLLVADACDALGDADGAHLERRAAEATLTALGAGGARTTLPGGLTGREAEVLALVAAGKTNRAIADALFISEKTVASHLSHIFTKLGVASRSAATAWAYEHGLA